MANKVGRDNGVLSVLKHTLEGAIGGFLDGSLDFVVGGLLFEANNEIYNRNIDCGDTEGETTAKDKLIAESKTGD